MPGTRREPRSRRRSAASPSVPSDPNEAPGDPKSVGNDYRRLFELAPDAIIILDKEGRYIDANTAASRLTGYSWKELTKMRVGEPAVPAQRRAAVEQFNRLRKIGRIQGDRVMRRKDGTPVTVEEHAVKLGGGTYQAIFRNVSERVAVQEELQRSVDAHSTLVNLCDAAVISADPGGLIRSWNPAAVKLFGYPPTEAIGMPLARLVPAAMQRRFLDAFEGRMGRNRSKPSHCTLNVDGVRRDGSVVPVEVSIAVGGRGKNRISTGVLRDMSEHRAVVERLNDALQRLQFHIERMPLAYIVWDVDFRVVEWNPAAEQTFGYAKAQAVGQHAYTLVVPPEAIEAVDRVWADLLHGDTSSHSINANMRRDGSRLTCEWFNTPLLDSAGQVRGVASMVRDMTEREAMEARIRDAQKLESLGVLAGGIAHDFNSSLMVILGNAALLRSTKGVSLRALEHIELIEEAGSRANELIKHLLAYARTGRHNPQTTDLNSVIRDSLTFVRSSLGKTCELELRLAKQLDPVVADRSQVEQIVLNLCLNAKQAMPRGGTISLTTRRASLTAAQAARCVPYDARPGDYVEIVVTDTGCGMDEATRSRIFDPFFTTKAEGHGLGLAAVLGILRQHHAAAWVESEVGKGTKMHVFFPVKNPTK